MKPGIKRIIAGGLLVVVGIGIPVFIAVNEVIKLAATESEAFVVPGMYEVQVDEPGRYYLWHDHKTVHEGVSYNHPAQLPHGLSIVVEDSQGEGLELHSSTTITTSSMDKASHSIAYVEIVMPGAYTIEVDATDERVFSWSAFDSSGLIRATFTGMGIALLCGVVGSGLVIWGAIRVSRKEVASEPTVS